jgi:hypothetical protein
VVLERAELNLRWLIPMCVRFSSADPISKQGSNQKGAVTAPYAAPRDQVEKRPKQD